MAAVVISVVNQKGGVGKSTTAVNLGDALVERGNRVLVIDLDPQGQVGDSLGIDSDGLEHTMYEVMVERSKMEDAIVSPEDQGVGDSRVFCAPSRDELDDFEFALKRRVSREAVLADAIGRVREDFDYVVVDCHPSLNLLEINAMYAADGLIIPVTPEKLPLHATRRLLEAVEEVREARPASKVLGALLTKVDVRTNLTRSARDTLREVFRDQGQIFETEIRYNVRIAETPGFSASVLLAAPDSQGARDYRSLAEEVVGRVGR